MAEGTDVVIVQAYERIWHLPRKGDEQLARRTLCGLEGFVYSAQVTLERKACQVCIERAPKGVIVKTRARPKSGKRRGVPSRISEAHLRALHAAHLHQRISLNELARRYWQRFGYASQGSMHSTLCKLLKDRGLETHDRIEMTVEASTKNGLSPRDDKTRRARRVAAGLTTSGRERQPSCGRCAKPAQRGSDFCFAHDPARAAERAAMTARMRARSPLHNRPDLEDAAPLIHSLLAYKASGGKWSDLARLSGVSQAWIAHVAQGEQARVAQGRAAAIRVALKASGGSDGPVPGAAAVGLTSCAAADTFSGEAA